MSVKAILTEQQKSYTKAEEDALLSDYYNKDYIDTNMAPLDTPTFIGVPKAPTAAAGTNTTQIATTAFVEQAKNTRVPMYGRGKNLLRNWYFVGGGTDRGVFPVNQRGISSAVQSSSVLAMDGWRVAYGSGGVDYSLASGYFEFGPHNSSSYATLEQALDSSMTGKTLTASILLSDGTLLYGTATVTGGDDYFYNAYPDGKNFRLYLTGGNLFIVRRTTASVQIVAIKLELGTEQTLCHQENGVWVLNEIPNYEEELIKCQTSTADSSDTYANKILATGQEIGYVETGTTASRNYYIGECFNLNGRLYEVTYPISSGNTITVNANCKEIMVGDNLVGRPSTVCKAYFENDANTLAIHLRMKDDTHQIFDIRKAGSPALDFKTFNGSAWTTEWTLPNIAYKEVPLNSSVTGTSFSPTSRTIGTCSNWLGVPASKILSFKVRDCSLNPAAILVVSTFNDDLYIAATQQTTLINDHLKVAIIYIP